MNADWRVSLDPGIAICTVALREQILLASKNLVNPFRRSSSCTAFQGVRVSDEHPMDEPIPNKGGRCHVGRIKASLHLLLFHLHLEVYQSGKNFFRVKIDRMALIALTPNLEG